MKIMRRNFKNVRLVEYAVLEIETNYLILKNSEDGTSLTIAKSTLENLIKNREAIK